MKQLFLWFSIVATSAVFAAEPNVLTDAEKAAGWRLLFDGKTTAGWRAIGKKEFPAAGWVVEEGSLRHVANAGGGDIVTVEDFENFEFAWEWKIGKAGNSGVKYNLPNPAVNIGCEYQMLDDAGHPDGRRAGGKNRTGGLYDLIAPAPEGKPMPLGEWNTSRIVVNGDNVEHWLNGVKTLGFQLGSAELKELIAKSKYRKQPAFGIKKAGPILIQDHKDDVWLRNIKVREIKQAAAAGCTEP